MLWRLQMLFTAQISNSILERRGKARGVGLFSETKVYSFETSFKCYKFQGNDGRRGQNADLPAGLESGGWIRWCLSDRG